MFPFKNPWGLRKVLFLRVLVPSPHTASESNSGFWVASVIYLNNQMCVFCIFVNFKNLFDIFKTKMQFLSENWQLHDHDATTLKPGVVNKLQIKNWRRKIILITYNSSNSSEATITKWVTFFHIYTFTFTLVFVLCYCNFHLWQ